MPQHYLPTIIAGTEKSLSELTVDALRLYHGIIHSSPVAIAVIQGDEMVVIMANQACLELWGADAAIIGRSLYETLPDLMAQAGHILRDIIATGKPFYGNEIAYVVNRRGQPQTGYFDFVWQPRFTAEGAVEGITAIATEVTERAISNREIKQSREQLHVLANTMPQVVWMAEGSGRVYYYNDRIDFYAGAEKMPDGSWSWQGIVHPEEEGPTTAAWNEAVNNKTPYEMEHRLLMKNGSYRWHLSRAVPHKNDQGDVMAWFGTATDIHQQKTFAEKLETEVAARTAELQKAISDLSDQKKKDETKDEFISIASHELKTPLTIAQGYLELAAAMIKEKPDGDLQLTIEKSATALKRLNNIIGDFLDTNKMQHGKLLLNYSPFDINEIIAESIEFIQKTGSGRVFTIRGIKGKQIVHGDGERMRHVLSNLLSNAIKYSPQGTPVEVTTTVNNGQLQVAVTDSGIGIAPEDIPYIFNRYFRVKDIAASHQGMGIGLYLSAEIIHRHKGKIWVESSKGKGSSFYFSIPLLPAHTG